MDTESEQIREVYAHFGLAIYCAQVLEHGLVNALVAFSLISSNRHNYSSAADWAKAVDSFMDKRFEYPIGQLITTFRKTTPVPDDLESILLAAQKRRNFLVHNYFRERATEMVSASGRDAMIEELQDYRETLSLADAKLESFVAPMFQKYGITEEMVGKTLDQLLKKGEV